MFQQVGRKVLVFVLLACHATAQFHANLGFMPNGELFPFGPGRTVGYGRGKGWGPMYTKYATAMLQRQVYFAAETLYNLESRIQGIRTSCGSCGKSGLSSRSRLGRHRFGRRF